MTITNIAMGKTALVAGVICFLTACELPTKTEQQSYDLFKGLEAVEGAEKVTLTINQGSAVGRDAYFEFEVANINSPLLRPGVYDGWCIDWTKPIAQQGDTHDGLQMYSTFGKEEWKPLNYFLNIKDELKATDPELTFAEFQAVIWSVQNGPEFDVNKLTDDELPPRLKKDGKANFSREKVNDIIEDIRNQSPAFEYTSNTQYALFLKTGDDEQDVMIPTDPPKNVSIRIIDLGTVNGNQGTVAMAINNKGQITGHSNAIEEIFNNKIFVWEEATGMQALPRHPEAADFHLDDIGHDINKKGQIVGHQWPVPIKWDPITGIKAFTEGIPVALHSHGVATGINDDGIVSGYRYAVSDSVHSYAVYWDENDAEHRLPSFSESLSMPVEQDFTNAFDINNNMQIVGYSLFPGEDHRAAMWENGEIKLLGNLGNSSEANAINDHGQAVGFIQMTESFFTRRAFYWDDATGMTLIPGLEDIQSTANDINNNGQIAGYLYDYEGFDQVGFLWDSTHGLILLEPYEGDPTSGANGLNDKGEIVGSSSRAPQPGSRAVRWTVSFE